MKYCVYFLITFFPIIAFSYKKDLLRNYDFHQIQKKAVSLSGREKPKAIPEIFDSNFGVVEVYTRAYALELINLGKHIYVIKTRDRCQIAKDIRDRALISESPIYQHFFGEMLIYGACFKKNIPLGVEYLRIAARQGLPQSMLQLSRYYSSGEILIKNGEKAVRLAFAAAKMNNIRAKLLLVELFLAGYGNPVDYEKAYYWLYHSVFNDPVLQKKATKILSIFVNLIPPKITNRIHNFDYDEF